MRSHILPSLIAALIFTSASTAQRRPGIQSPKAPPVRTRSAEIGQTAVVIDETLSVLREKPSLFAGVIQRMQRGRRVTIQGVTEAEGVTFYKIVAPPRNYGWVQADAVVGKFRPKDEERLLALMRGYDGWDTVEIGSEFLALFPQSARRPEALLLFGNAVEEMAAKITRSANSQLKPSEIAASGAPAYSHYLNFSQLDRYRKLGITFLFNAATKQFHYDGAAWKEITAKFPASTQAAEAKKRIDDLNRKMETTAK